MVYEFVLETLLGGGTLCNFALKLKNAGQGTAGFEAFHRRFLKEIQARGPHTLLVAAWMPCYTDCI